MPEGSITGFYVLRPTAGFKRHTRMPVVAFDGSLPIAADGAVGYRGNSALQLPDGRVALLGVLEVSGPEAWLSTMNSEKKEG